MAWSRCTIMITIVVSYHIPVPVYIKSHICDIGFVGVRGIDRMVIGRIYTMLLYDRVIVSSEAEEQSRVGSDYLGNAVVVDEGRMTWG